MIQSTHWTAWIRLRAAFLRCLARMCDKRRHQPERARVAFQPLPRSVSPQDITLTTDALKQHPGIASAVARVIGHWSVADMRLVGIVSAFLEADFAVAHDMLTVITSTKARRDAIHAAAKRSLSDKPDDLRLFQATVRCVSSARLARNPYAHWTWGYTPKLKDKLILAEPEAASTAGAELIRLLEDVKRGAEATPSVDDIRSRRRELFHVVSEADVERDIRDAETALEWMSDLYKLLVWGPRVEPAEGVEARLRLLAEHRIREAYEGLAPTQNSP